MDVQAFEAKLKADGYAEIETKTYSPAAANGEHGHHFSVRGLVLAGAFTVIQDNHRITYGPGEVFAVAAGDLHCEAIGADGATALVGRKF
jgi:quercetin dioxygenase-like cupin family protein